MKIVTFEDLRAMPFNILFTTYTPCVFGPLCIKGGTVGGNFLFKELWSVDALDDNHYVASLLESEESGEHVLTRYDDYHLMPSTDPYLTFAVLDKVEIASIIESLKHCLK